MAKKKPSKAGAKKQDQISSYYNSLSLQTCWEEFATATNKNGTLKYRTVWAWIKKKTSISWQQQFLWWILGPRADEPANPAFSKYSQFDWEAKRERGFWHSGSNIESLKAELANKRTALESIKSVGIVNIDLIGQLKNVLAQLNREYGNNLFLPDADAKENALRLKLYLSAHKDIADLLTIYQTNFAKSQGVAIDNLADFLAIFATGMNSTATALGFANDDSKTIEGKSSSSIAMEQITKMMISKAASQEMELPDPEMNKVIEMNFAKDKRKVN